MKSAINTQGVEVEVALDTPVKTVNGIHYLLTEAEAAELAAKEAEWQAGATARQNAQAEQSRIVAYVGESDPLFFKYQRGEATEQEWLDKVQEIKTRFPKGE